MNHALSRCLGLSALLCIGAGAGAAAATLSGAANRDAANQHAANQHAANRSAVLARLDEVQPFTGPAWLNHLGLPLESTPIGYVGDRMRVPRVGPTEPTPLLDVPTAAEPPFSMTGADIYRLSCRACHGPTGAGAPPVIPSATKLAEGMSAALLRQRNPRIPPAMAVQLAQGTEQALRQRLRNGGVKMPPFSYLDSAEEDALFVHLKRLAGAPHAGPEQTIAEPPARVGELVVRGTCHICHGAHQWRAPPQENVPQVSGIPALSVFPRLGVARVVRKVQQRGPGYVSFQRMPQLPYLTRQEIVATYLYLVRYPATAATNREANDR